MLYETGILDDLDRLDGVVPHKALGEIVSVLMMGAQLEPELHALRVRITQLFASLDEVAETQRDLVDDLTHYLGYFQ